jgi:hypothetical protein
MVTSCQKCSADQAPNGINEGVAGPFMPAWCLICVALLACPSPAPPTKSLDLSLTLTNNVIHVNDVPEHLLTMYPVCTRERIPTIATASPTQIIKPREASSPKRSLYDRVAAPIRDCSVQLTIILDSTEGK